MPIKRISLYDLEGLALIVAHSSGVIYSNQVNGVVCAQEELEGVLCPLEPEPDTLAAIEALPYPQGRAGIAPEMADEIDRMLSVHVKTRFLRTDRALMDQSCEAWIFVRFQTPDSQDLALRGTYSGSAFGFGSARGVLTWPNSD